MNYQLLFPELRDSKIRLTIGGPVMRIFVTLACLLGVVVGLGVAQEGEKQARRHFDPPSVVTAVDAIFPFNSVASGTVARQGLFYAAPQIPPPRVLRGGSSPTDTPQRAL